MPESPREWGEIYRRERALYERSTQAFADLVAHILEAAGIDVVQIERRTKTVDSFSEKVARKGERYENPLTDITDLVGLRIIVYYREDLDRVGDVLRQEFAVDDSHFSDPTNSTAPDQFGYASVHYVVHLGDNRANLAEWKAFAGIAAEIQVRTALQHAWAAIDHKLRYKQPRSEGLPRALQRDLFRLSALLELADKEFSALREATAETRETYSSSVGAGELDIPLDVISLTVYLASAGAEETWGTRGLEKGMLEPEWESYDNPEEIEQFDKAYLLEVARAVGLRTVAELDAFLTGAEEWGNDALDVYIDEARKFGEVPSAFPTDLLTVLLLMRHGVRPDEVPESRWVATGDPEPFHWGSSSLEGLIAAVEAFREHN